MALLSLLVCRRTAARSPQTNFPGYSTTTSVSVVQGEMCTSHKTFAAGVKNFAFAPDNCPVTW
ncbi:hypothetical protein ECZU34_61450 [Escherichia coli]|nr:hypothetical protein ECZU34_61450 [Escherichia coli]